VTVAFGVTVEGLTENVRARESTQACFEEAAVAAVGGWSYKPRRVDGAPQPQDDLESTFTFVIEETAEIQDFDARPIVRVPPVYPSKCERRAADREGVLVEFDVSEGGTTENVRIPESTNECFNEAAKTAVAKWRYRPKLESGKAVARDGVQTMVIFDLTNRAGPTLGARDKMREGLRRAQDILRQRGDPKEALVELAKVEAKYGADLPAEERALFYQLRGGAHLVSGQRASALEDFLAAQRAGVLTGDAAAAVERLVRKLEAGIAAERADADDSPKSER
jgi:TonB family protein